MASATAYGAQTSASESPRVSGPLEQIAKECPDRQKARHEGKVIAVLEMCLWIYELERSAHVDPLRSYGIGWLQTTVNPVNGWCARKVESTLSARGSSIEDSFSPKRTIRTNKKRRTTVRVTTDAGGYALTEGSLSQSFTLFPKSLSARRRNGTLKTTWRGRESSTLAFAQGFEISWSATATPGLSGGLGHMSFIKARGC